MGLLWSREHAVSNQVSSSRVECVVCVQSCVAWLRCTCPVLRSHALLSATPLLPPAADWLRPEDSKPSAIAYDSSRRRLVWCVIPYACIRFVQCGCSTVPVWHAVPDAFQQGTTACCALRLL